MKQVELFHPNFVQSLFDEMAQTYGIVNLISSLGFTRRWRRQCVQAIDIPSHATVLDLMSGQGELCPEIARHLNHGGKIIGIDLSASMCYLAQKQRGIAAHHQVTFIQADSQSCPLEENSVDAVYAAFGLKTFNQDQIAQLAREVRRVLRPGGQFSFLEISVPRSKLLRRPYLAYINFVIPFIGRLVLGNPDNYRLLGQYTTFFGDCRHVATCFAQADLEVEFKSFFWGCATGLIGRKA